MQVKIRYTLKEFESIGCVVTVYKNPNWINVKPPSPDRLYDVHLPTAFFSQEPFEVEESIELCETSLYNAVEGSYCVPAWAVKVC